MGVGVLLGLCGAAGAANAPRPVSPGARTAGAVAELRCPTFSWAGTPGATGYEIAVFRIDEAADAEPVLVTRATVAGDARAWTPAIGACLERGQRYAWSVAAVGGERTGEREARTERRAGSIEGGDTASAGELDWSPALLFEVEAAPSRDELDRAVATLERYLDSEEGRRATAPETRAAPPTAEAIRRDREKDEHEPRSPVADSPGEERTPLVRPGRERMLPGPLAPAAPSATLRVESAGYSPAIGDASLTVSEQIHLAAASDVFKNGVLFLWDNADGNTALGREALASVNDSDGRANTALGRSALRANTSGARNSATGAFALYRNQNGNYNTATGAAALYANTGGSYNTAVGFVALAANSSGFRNTATGAYALRVNGSGEQNTATGWEALFNNSTGNHNTATGARALYGMVFGTHTGSFNTATGSRALYRTTTGTFNTATGSQALYSNATGYANTAGGGKALRANVGGIRNTATGYAALLSNSTGNGNTSSGYGALDSNTTGSLSTAVGYQALAASTTTNFNTAIGSRALLSSTGSNNTALGSGAGFYNTTGNNSIFIGNAGNPIGSDNATIKIGTQGTQTSAFIAGIHPVVVTGVGVLVSGTGQLGIALSSAKLKQDIHDIGALGDRLLDLRPVAFRYRQQVEGNADTPLEFGLIAEEVAEIFPELVVYDQEGKPQTVKYHLLSALLLGELKEQHGALELQNSSLRQQQAELQELRARLAALESRSTRGGRQRGDGGSESGRAESGERSGRGRR